MMGEILRIEDLIKRNSPNIDCEQYEEVLDKAQEYHKHGIVLSARCRYYGQDFRRDSDNLLEPACYKCQRYVTKQEK